MRASKLAFPCIAFVAGALSACATPTLPEPSEGDWSAITEATEEALEENQTGEGRNWENTRTGNRGAVIPVATFERDGRPCREYQQIFTAEGATQYAYGMACRREDGSWETADYSGFATMDRRGRDHPRYAGHPGYRDPYYYGHPRTTTSLGFGIGFGF